MSLDKFDPQPLIFLKEDQQDRSCDNHVLQTEGIRVKTLARNVLVKL